MADRFPHIFSPITINGMTVRNRIFSAGHYAGWWSFMGLPNDDCVAYFRERAVGGIGLVTIGATTVREGDHPAYFQNLDGRIIEWYQKIADAVHEHGAKVIAQFCPRGPDVRFEEFGEPPVELPTAASLAPHVEAASDRKAISPAQHVAGWSIEALADLVERTGDAASRAKAGGVDGVELHAHQHHTHSQFLSPCANQRTDAYGGSFEKRARLLRESLTAMRRAVGDDFVVGLRCKSNDHHPDGMVEDDYIRLIQMLKAEGCIDYVNMTAGNRYLHVGNMVLPDGQLLPSVAKIRAAVDVPVLHSGRIRDAELAERALASGQVDMVGMTKAHFADAHFVNKVKEGRLQDIRTCIRCGYCCDGGEGAVGCIYNPLTSRERQWAVHRPAPTRRRVVVVGAGPAGLEAALTAALRGHEVIVLERSERVGGQVRLAGAAPMRSRFTEIADFYEHQSKKGCFEVRLGVDARPDTILGLHPDVVIVATGSISRPAVVPGLNHGGALTVHDVLKGKADSERRVLIVDRFGHAEALVAADYLSHRGVQVQFESAMEKVAQRMGDGDASLFYEALCRQGVTFRAGFDIVGTDGDQVMLRDLFNGQEYRAGPFDAVLVHEGPKPIDELSKPVRENGSEVYVIGNATGTRNIAEATIQGAQVGREI